MTLGRNRVAGKLTMAGWRMHGYRALGSKTAWHIGDVLEADEATTTVEISPKACMCASAGCSVPSTKLATCATK